MFSLCFDCNCLGSACLQQCNWGPQPFPWYWIIGRWWLTSSLFFVIGPLCHVFRGGALALLPRELSTSFWVSLSSLAHTEVTSLFALMSCYSQVCVAAFMWEVPHFGIAECLGSGHLGWWWSSGSILWESLHFWCFWCRAVCLWGAGGCLSVYGPLKLCRFLECIM